MATNPTPEDNDMVIALAEDLADGCHLHEVAIGIKQNTEVVIRAAITATTAANLALGGARTAVSGAYDAMHAADAAATVVLRNCRLRLVKLLGTQYSPAWGQAGFPNQSTAVPGSLDQRFTLLGALKAYFTANPAAESVDMEATAAICTTAHTTLSDARQALNTAESALTTAKVAAADTLRTLRKRVRGLIDELGQLIADDDARYEAFGLNIPANPTAPEPITSLTATAQGGGKVFLQWAYTRRMAGTRLRGKQLGVDPEPRPLGTVDGLEKMMTGLAPGSWEFSAVAYNDGGDADASPIAAVTVT